MVFGANVRVLFVVCKSFGRSSYTIIMKTYFPHAGLVFGSEVYVHVHVPT